MGRKRGGKKNVFEVVFTACAIFAFVFVAMYYTGVACEWIWNKVLVPLLKALGYDCSQMFETKEMKVLTINGARVTKPITRAEGKNNALKGLNPLRHTTKVVKQPEELSDVAAAGADVAPADSAAPEGSKKDN